MAEKSLLLRRSCWGTGGLGVTGFWGNRGGGGNDVRGYLQQR